MTEIAELRRVYEAAQASVARFDAEHAATKAAHPAIEFNKSQAHVEAYQAARKARKALEEASSYETQRTLAIADAEDKVAKQREEQQRREKIADDRAAMIAAEREADDGSEPEEDWTEGRHYHGFPLFDWSMRYREQYDWERLAKRRGVAVDPRGPIHETSDQLKKHLASGAITIADLLDTNSNGGPLLPQGFACVHPDPDMEMDRRFIHEHRAIYDPALVKRYDEARGSLAKKELGSGNLLANTRRAMEASREDVWEQVCPTFNVHARTVDRSTDDSSGYLLHFEVDDQPRSIVLLQASIESGACFKQLADAGFVVEKDKRKAFVRMVREAPTRAKVHVEWSPGWFGSVFLSPTGEVITGPDTDDMLDPKRLALGVIGHALHPDAQCDPSKGGTLEAWQANVVKPSWSGRTPQFALAPILGLAGVVLQLADAENFVEHLYGRTTGGKSTSQTIAAGCAANPEHNKGTLADAGADDPDIRAARLRGTGTSWGIDGKEGGHVNRLVSTIRDGAVGNGGSILTISSEKGPLELSRAAGVDLDAGVLVRLLPIDLGVDAPLYRIDPRAADAIKASARTNYGHALAPLVRQVLAEGLHTGEDLKQEVADRADRLLAGSTDPELHRAAQHVGVLWVTGELMQDAKLLPPEADVPKLMQWLWDGYLAFRRQWAAGVTTSAKQAREKIMAFANGPHVVPLDAANGLGSAWGWRDGATLYIRTDKLPAVLGKHLGARRTMRRVLGGMLMVPGDATETLSFRKVPGAGFCRHYRICLD